MTVIVGIVRYHYRLVTAGIVISFVCYMFLVFKICIHSEALVKTVKIYKHISEFIGTNLKGTYVF